MKSLNPVFKKATIEDIEKIHEQASNVKKMLQKKVENMKLGEQEESRELEKKYKPLIDALSVVSDQPPDVTDNVNKEGKKLIRMSELLNNVLKNIEVSNERLIADNPEYDDLLNPNVPKELNISQLAANTLNRINEIKNNLDDIKVNTSVIDEINNNLYDLSKIITIGKIDTGNVKAKLNDIFDLFTGSSIPINDSSIPVFMEELEKSLSSSASGLPLTETEKQILRERTLSFLDSVSGNNFDKRMVEDIVSSFVPDDDRTLRVLSKIDSNIQDLSIANNDLAEKLSDIPLGLASVFGSLPQLISKEISYSQLKPEEREKLSITTEKVIAATPADQQEQVLKVWNKIPRNANPLIDLVPYNEQVGNLPNIPFKRIGSFGGFIRADLLVGPNPKLEIYDSKGKRDVNTPPDGIKISDGLRTLLLNSETELNEKIRQPLEIPANEIQLISPYFQSSGRKGKAGFITGNTNTFSINKKLIAKKIGYEDPRLISPAELVKSVESIRPITVTRSPNISPQKTRVEIQSEKLKKGVKPSEIKSTTKKGNGMGAKLDKSGYFGKVWVNPEKLGYGILQVHKLNKNNGISKNIIIKKMVDQDFIDLMTKRYNKKKSYSPASIKMFKELSNTAGINANNINTNGYKKKLITAGAHYMNEQNNDNKIIKIITDSNELVDRLAVLAGSIEAGNSSPVVISELSQLADILLNKKIITKNEHKQIYEKYILQ